MNVIAFQKYQIVRQRINAQAAYRAALLNKTKPELLQELLDYHSSYRSNPNDIDVTVRAQFLVEVLEARSELEELKELAAEFKLKLKERLHRQLDDLEDKVSYV